MEREELSNFLNGVLAGSPSQQTRKLRDLESRRKKLNQLETNQKEKTSKAKKAQPAASLSGSPELPRSSTPAIPIVKPRPDPPQNSPVSDKELEVLPEQPEPSDVGPEGVDGDGLADLPEGREQFEEFLRLAAVSADFFEGPESDLNDQGFLVNPAHPNHNMAPRLPSKAELKARSTVKRSIAQANTWLTQPVPNTDRARIAIDQAKSGLEALRTTGMERLSQTEDDELEQAEVDFDELIMGFEADYDKTLLAITKKDPSTVTPAVQLSADKHIAQGKINKLDAQITALTTKMTADLQAEDADQELSKEFVIGYQGKAAHIRTLIRPGLAQLHDDLIALDRSQAHTDTVLKACGDMVQKHDSAVATALDSLLARNLTAASLTFMPGVSSTANQSIILNSSSQSSSSGGSRPRTAYYGKEEYPTFDGDPLTYPSWRQEMQEEVLPGKCDANAIRLIAKLGPVKGLSKKYNKQVDVWDDFDKEYADSRVVAGRITEEFLSKKRLDGATDEAKLVSLEELVTRCFLTLDIVGQSHQLTENQPMIEVAVRLLPMEYRKKYAQVIVDAEAKNTPRRSLTAKEEYDLLSEWLRAQSRLIKIHLKETLKRPQRDRTPPRDTGNGNNGNNGRNGKNGKGRNRKNNGRDTTPPPGNGHGHGFNSLGQRTAGSSRGSTRAGDSVLGSVTKDNMDELKKEWTKMGPCPACKAPGHAYESSKEQGHWHASSCFSDCGTFMDRWDLEKRAKFVVDNNFCVRCLSRRHNSKECRRPKEKWYCRVTNNNGDQCKELHHNHLHGCKTKLWNLQELSRPITGGLIGEEADEDLRELLDRDVLLPVQSVVLKPGLAATVLFDNGSTSSTIENSLAKELGYKPRHIRQLVRLCGKEPEIMDLTYYCLTLNVGGETRECAMLGLDSITTTAGEYSVEAAYDVFKHIPRGALEVPSGHVRMLIGQDHPDLLLSGNLGENQVDGLRVWESRFGSGRVLTGHHPDIRFRNPVKSEQTIMFQQAEFSPLSAQFCSAPLCWNQFGTSTDLLPNFYEAELLGYSQMPKCKLCQTCKVCTFQSQGHTVKEKMEYQLMRDSIWRDEETDTIHCNFPIVGDEKAFVDNRHQAIARAESLQRSLGKRKQLAAYSECVADYIARDVWKEISTDKIEEYKAAGGSIHYVSHHAVYKPGSLSTKMRLVVDSSLKNNWKGPRLSSLYAKGPNVINDLYKVLVKWRSLKSCGIYDLKKAYHQIRTGEKEFFMRLVVWRDSPDEPWRTFGHQRAGMGDVPSSGMLELAKEIGAVVGEEIDVLMAQQLVDLSYVDDGIFGGEKEDVDRMAGETIIGSDGAPLHTGTCQQIYSKIGFRLKGICKSGETNPTNLETQGKVLGLDWAPTEDEIIFKLRINLSEKLGTVRTGPDVSLEDIEKIVFTKRIALQIAAQNFDPLGMIACFTVRFKLLLKEIVARDLGWDEVLQPDLQSKWRDLCIEVLGLPALSFPRSLHPVGAAGRPQLIVYADGSTVAFGSVAYLRWQLHPEAKIQTYLLTAKSRVTPKAGMTPPRSELNGLVVATRIADKVLDSLTVRPERVTIMTDSSCSVSACDLNANSLATFFANRVLEITQTMQTWGPAITGEASDEPTERDLANLAQMESEGDKFTLVDKIVHTPGVENPADLPTRGFNIEWHEMKTGMLWQDGPGYLLKPRSEWSMAHRPYVTDVPAQERKKKFLENVGEELALNVFQKVHLLCSRADSSQPSLYEEVNRVMMSSDKYAQVRGTLARVIRAWRADNFGAAYQPHTIRDLQEADWLMCLATMRDLNTELKEKKSLQSLALFWRHSIARTRGRLSPEDMERTMGFDSLIVLPCKSRLSYLLLMEAHREDHRAGGDNLFRVRRKGYWIIRGRLLADRIARDCIVCTKRTAVTQQQKMADLPSVIFDVPCRPFSHIALDFTGAVKVKGMVNQRTTTKCFPLLFCCVNTGSLHIQLAQGYSTEDFMLQFNHFVAIRGMPVYVRADMGSQIVKAGKLMDRKLPQVQGDITEGDLPAFKWRQIEAAASAMGVQFSHCATQAQWRNGRAESAVRGLKSTLKHLYPKGRLLNYAEYSCLLSRAADVINRRPVGVRHHGGGTGDLCVITPALLIQGGRICRGPEHDNNICTDMDMVARMDIVEQNFMCWWRMWLDQVWESLLPIKKWRETHQNLQVNDLVLLKYQGKYSPPVFRYAKVTKTHPDKHGLVRNVTVISMSKRARDGARVYSPRKMDEQLVPVQRCVLLLPVEAQAELPPPNEELHICEDDLRVPQVFKPGQPLTVAPTPPPTTDPTVPVDMNITVPLTQDQLAFNFFGAEAQHPGQAKFDTDFYCWECDVRWHNLGPAESQ